MIYHEPGWQVSKRKLEAGKVTGIIALRPQTKEIRQDDDREDSIFQLPGGFAKIYARSSATVDWLFLIVRRLAAQNMWSQLPFGIASPKLPYFMIQLDQYHSQLESYSQEVVKLRPLNLTEVPFQSSHIYETIPNDGLPTLASQRVRKKWLDENFLDAIDVFEHIAKERYLKALKSPVDAFNWLRNELKDD